MTKDFVSKAYHGFRESVNQERFLSIWNPVALSDGILFLKKNIKVMLKKQSLFFSSCKIEKNADSQLTTTESNIEHVCIPLTDAQIIGLYNTLTTVQTRAVVLVSSLEEFKSYLNTSLVAVCFTATWSGPCKMYKPIYHKVSEKYTASVCRFLEVDVDESPELAELFNVAKIPTTIIIKNGEVVATFVEILSEKALTELIESYKVK